MCGVSFKKTNRLEKNRQNAIILMAYKCDFSKQMRQIQLGLYIKVKIDS
jgi:hypothetical protein